jgi:hypothetical protein
MKIEFSPPLTSFLASKDFFGMLSAIYEESYRETGPNRMMFYLDSIFRSKPHRG